MFNRFYLFKNLLGKIMKNVFASILAILFLTNVANAATITVDMRFTDDPTDYNGLVTGIPLEAAGDPNVQLSLTYDPTAVWQDTTDFLGRTAQEIDTEALAASLSFGSHLITPNRVEMIHYGIEQVILMYLYFGGSILTDPVNGELGQLNANMRVRFDTNGNEQTTGDPVSTTDWVPQWGELNLVRDEFMRGNTGYVLLDVTPVPLPGSLPLLAAGALAFGFVGRKARG